MEQRIYLYPVFAVFLLFLDLGGSIKYGGRCSTSQNEEGYCYLSKDCPKFIREPDVVKEICSNDYTEILYCCPVNNMVMEDVSKHKNLKLINQKGCGTSVTSRILNGEDSAVAELPWVAYVFYLIGKDIFFTCCATLINSNYALTAADCFSSAIANSENFLGYYVRLGEFNLDTEKDCYTTTPEEECMPPPQDVKVQFIFPPCYHEKDETCNIALLKLEKQAKMRVNIRPICLPVGPNQRCLLDGENATVCGWGYTENDVLSSTLKKVTLPVVSCSETDPYPNTGILTNHICTSGGKGGTIGLGDYGCPLTIPRRQGKANQTFLYGIVASKYYEKYGSASYVCVPYFMKWILDTITP